MISRALSTYGTDQDKADQAKERESKVDRLRLLTGQQDQIATIAAQRNAIPHSGAAFSGINNNRHDYDEKLKRDSEVASLESELSGSGPARVQHSYGGTNFAMGPATQALQRRAAPQDAGDGDNLDYFGRLAQVQGQQADTERRRTAGFLEDTADDPAMAQRRGDVARSQHSQDIASDTEARAKATMTDSVHRATRQKLWDDEERARTLYPFNPNADRYGTQQRVAEINAGAKVGAANVAAGSRVDSAAINSLQRIGGAQTFTPEQNQRADDARDAIKPLVPGQGAAPAAAPGGKVFPRAELGRFAQEHGFASEQAAAEYLQTAHGYQVQ